jgi:hypothetical protein
LILGATALSLAHFLTFPFLEHPITTDIRNFLYYASRVSAGELPYLHFFENKTPLACFVGGFLHGASRLLEVDPLLGIRGGYLVLAAVGGPLAFVVHSRLSGTLAGGVFGLAAYVAFPLIGGLPSIGNVPKLLVALLASAAALFARRGRWVLAGVAGGLAFLDWQIGAAVVAAVGVAAVTARRRFRGRRLLKVAAGVLIALLPLVVVYAGNGGLARLADQTILTIFARGTASLDAPGLWADWPRRAELFRRSSDGRWWIAALGVPGLLVVLQRLVRQAPGPGRVFVVCLALYHYAIVAFSILDFQGYGDVFILLHSVAFFVAATLSWSHQLLASWLRSVGRPRLAPAAGLVVALLVARPWVAGRTFHVVLDPAAAAVTLRDQRRLAQDLRNVLNQPDVAVIGPAELRFLSGTVNPFPVVFWNRAAHRYFRTGPDEPEAVTLRRLALAARIRIAICEHDGPHGVCASAFGAPVSWRSSGAEGTVRLFAVSP